MAAPKVLAGSKYLILVGDGGSPTELFTQPCGIVAKDVTYESETEEDRVPDCSNLDAPEWKLRTVVALGVTIKASGKLDTDVFDSTFRAWWASGTAKNVQIKTDASNANGGGYHQGSFVLGNVNIKSEGRKYVEVDFDLQSTGEVTWTAAV